MSELIIKNKRIIDFYNQNESLDIEAINLIVINLLEQLLDGMNSNVISGINSQILSDVGELKSKMFDISSSINKLNTDITNSIYVKLQDVKKDYIEEYRNILLSNFSQNNEKLGSLLQQNNSSLIDKTTLLLNDVLPKNNESQQNIFKDTIVDFQKSINEDTKLIMSSLNKDDKLNEFLIKFENKYTQLIQPFQGIINSSEERLQREITNVKNNQMPETLLKELTDFFNKYKNSSYKGQLGEMQLETILNQVFPCDEIIRTTSIKAAGDFRINRENREPLIIETKDYDRNVTLDEVKKFIRDIEEQKCHGVFLSQNSGITSKQNFQIDMINKKILIYIHNVKYDSTVIKMAIDVIDNLSEKFNLLENDDIIDFSISDENLKEINKEYSDFIKKKLLFIENFKENQKKLLNQVEDMKFPCLSKFLSQKCGNILINENQGIICSICNKFTAQNNKSLAAHQKACKKRQNLPESEKIVVNTNN